MARRDLLGEPIEPPDPGKPPLRMSQRAPLGENVTFLEKIALVQTVLLTTLLIVTVF